MRSPSVSIRNLRVLATTTGGAHVLLEDVNLSLAQEHFTAIIGPSGCGKSTLLRALAGIVLPSSGEIELFGYPLAEYRKTFPLALAYLPQFSESHDELTVREVLQYAIKLQLPSSVDAATRDKWLGYLMELAGLKELQDQRYKTLSGGQRRRVALAETMVADPPVLLVDELTSGLDPHAEASMMEWLEFLAHRSGKTILLVTHSIKNLDRTDSVIFMRNGKVLFHGNHRSLLEQFQLKSIEELYEKEDLASHQAVSSEANTKQASEGGTGDGEHSRDIIRTAGPASMPSQFLVLVERHFILFCRDRAQMILHAILIFTFPALVAVFALDGLPQVRNLSLALDSNVLRSLQEQLLYLKDSVSSATLTSGLIMFQVILLTLAGANNGSREIAKELSILGKEQRCGLSTVAYVSSKFVFVTLLALLQAFWMTWFVKTICKFPGDFGTQLAILFLTTLAMGT
ncbi:MAG: ATP-binding cassette domain-containing protein, partial [Verrucomicrobia bacterium]|nr:ATP-binding cassette domain-containing protein [Verrucomicrobiota bacterium]